MSTVTCRNTEWLNPDTGAIEPCPCYGQPKQLDLTYSDPAGMTHSVDQVVCGKCGQPISEVAPS